MRQSESGNIKGDQVSNSVSGVVITYNEEKNIKACLESLKPFCDEIIVVDSGSTDQTLNIAKSEGAKVFNKSWEGFGPQKNFALQKTTCNWIFSIDADERVTEELCQEILDTLRKPLFDLYRIRRRSFAYGAEIKYSGWYPDHVTRLFKKNFVFTNDLVHERIDNKGVPQGNLLSHLNHYRNENLEQAVSRMDRYSTAWARQNLQSKKGGVFKGVLKAFWTYIRIYFLKLGFLDGRAGLVIAITNSMGAFLKYSKLYFLQK